MDTRFGRVEWGQRKTEDTLPSVGERKLTSAANRRQPYTWNKHYAAFQAKHGHRQRVFCSSLSDVYDNQVPMEWRADLFKMIHETPNLDWLLLTKRPEQIRLLTPGAHLPENVWMGTTCEDQDAFDRRWPLLQRVTARVRFISYEPAIGPLTMSGHKLKPDWIICGGESGKGYRPMPLEWAHSMRDECEREALAFFFKQTAGKKAIPDDLMVRQFPAGAHSVSSQTQNTLEAT